MRAALGWVLLSTFLARLVPTQAQADQRELDCLVAMVNSNDDDNMFLDYTEFLHWMVASSDGCLKFTDLLDFEEYTYFQQIACTCNDYSQPNIPDLPCVRCNGGSTTEETGVIALPGVYPADRYPGTYAMNACRIVLARIDYLCINDGVRLEPTASPVTRAPVTASPVTTTMATSAPVLATPAPIETGAPSPGAVSITTDAPVVDSPPPVDSPPTIAPTTISPSTTPSAAPITTAAPVIVSSPTDAPMVDSPPPVAAAPTTLPSTIILPTTIAAPGTTDAPVVDSRPAVPATPTTAPTPSTTTGILTKTATPTTDATNGDDTPRRRSPISADDDDDDALSTGALGGIVVAAVLLAVVGAVGFGYRSAFMKPFKLASSSEQSETSVEDSVAPPKAVEEEEAFPEKDASVVSVSLSSSSNDQSDTMDSEACSSKGLPLAQRSYTEDVSTLTMGSEIVDKSDDMSYAYSLEAGTSQGTTASVARTGGGSVSEYTSTSESESNLTSRLFSRTIVAPPGKLGIVIDTTLEGPVVHTVNSQSPLAGTLFPGDIIVAVNDVDTRAMTASAITALMLQTSLSQRTLAVLSE